jgi:predicted small secreted protein
MIYPQQFHKEQNMLIKKIISSIVLVLILAILIQGCNTMRGAGQDIEKAGAAIEDAAK